jgi:GT2 family glycosyltransferase
VCFVDDDVRVLPGWADALRASFEDESVAFVTGRLGLEPNGAPVERPVAFLDAPHARVVDRDAVRDIGHGANLAVRRAALEAVGGFDEAFGPGAPFPAGEDMDLLDRLLGAGCVGRYEPGVAAWHVQWRTRRRLVPLEWNYGTGQGGRLGRLWAADRRRARRALRVAVWDDGVVDFSHCVRAGYRFGALLAATRLAGMARGALAYRLGGAVGSERRHRFRAN